MRQNIRTILIILLLVAISAITAIAVYNFAPLNVLEYFAPEPRENLGSTITTINGSDRISDSRAVINTNFSNLNTDKLESGSLAASLRLTNLYATSSLIDTLTLTNFLTTANGGTGTTSPTSNQVIIGNGSSGFKVIGFGTSGQFLTSAGNGVAPSWTTSAVDETGSFNFTGTYFGVKNFNASSTVANPIKLNTVSYAFPSSQGSASTTLWNDGSGNVSWKAYTPILFRDTTIRSVTSTTASTTVYTYTLTANEMQAGDQLQIDALCKKTGGGSGGNYCAIKWGTGSATTTLASGGQVSAANVPMRFDVRLVNNNSQSTQNFVGVVHNPNTPGSIYTGGNDTRNTGGQLYIAFEVKLADGADTGSFQGITITKY